MLFQCHHEVLFDFATCTQAGMNCMAFAMLITYPIIVKQTYSAEGKTF